MTVTATYQTAAGQPAAGTVHLRPVTAATNATPPRVVTTTAVSADLDEDGALTVQVVASDDPDWADPPVAYEVLELIARQPSRCYRVHIDGPGPVDLATLTHLT